MMTVIFEETQSILPRETFNILAIVLIVSDIFILICSFIESIGTPIWMFVASTVVFAAIIGFCFFVKLRIKVEDDVIYIRFLKKYEIPFDQVIDFKIGDVDIIRNYSGWGIKQVTFKNFISIGYERGISLKVTGKRVFTFSVSDPESFASILPRTES